MGKNSYKAQLNYYDHNYGWGNAGTCAQGDGRTWGAGSARTGVMYFPGLSNLKGKIINSVKITVTNRAGGQNAQKTAHFFRSASQGGINTSLGAGHQDRQPDWHAFGLVPCICRGEFELHTDVLQLVHSGGRGHILYLFSDGFGVSRLGRGHA